MSEPDKLDPDVVLAMMCDPRSVEDARPRAKILTEALQAARVPGDGHTLLALLMVAAGADHISQCPLGAERMGMLMRVMRARFEHLPTRGRT